MQVENYKSSFYCWIILFIFILLTVFFVLNFYNKTVAEISRNSAFNPQLNIEQVENLDN